MRLLYLAVFVVGSVAAPGCDSKTDPRCEAFAEHLAGVLSDERGGLDSERRVKMIESTVASCNAAGFDEATFACALAGQTTAAIKACEQGTENQ